jgi:hypothetical protein
MNCIVHDCCMAGLHQQEAVREVKYSGRFILMVALVRSSRPLGMSTRARARTRMGSLQMGSKVFVCRVGCGPLHAAVMANLDCWFRESEAQ